MPVFNYLDNAYEKSEQTQRMFKYLTDCLAEEGLSVSRRAVAKYRIQMNIPDSRQRGMGL